MSTTELAAPTPDNPADGTDWSLTDLARYLGVSAAGARKCAEQGLVPGHQEGGEWRFSSRAIRSWQLGRGRCNTAGERLTQKEILLRWMGAWANDPPFPVEPAEGA
jgi:helix-turn-helix protein